VEFLQLVSN